MKRDWPGIVIAAVLLSLIALALLFQGRTLLAHLPTDPVTLLVIPLGIAAVVGAVLLLVRWLDRNRAGEERL